MPSLPKVPILIGAAVIGLLVVMLTLDSRDRAELRRQAARDNDSWQSRGMFFPVTPAVELSPEQKEMVAAIGYGAAYEQAPDASGVAALDKERAQPGLNFVISAQAPAARVIAPDGTVLHTWEKHYGEVFADPAVSSDGRMTYRDTVDVQPDIDPSLVRRLPKKFLATANPGYKYFRRAYLYPNGDLLTFYSYLGAVKLDGDSNLLWSDRLMAHHDLDVTPDGRMYLLALRPREIPGLGEGGFLLSDYIAVYNAAGEREQEIPVLDAFLNSRYASMITRGPQQFDLLHTNTVEVLDGRHADRIAAFKAGNILVSCRNIDTIAVIDPAQSAVVWAATGPWVMQHEPVLLDNGRMLLFDNYGNGGYSRVTEFDPLTQEIAWEFAGTPPESFYSIGLGTAARLPNGNTLVTESTAGRAFELTPKKEIVWDYVNPERVTENGVELIAALFEVIRLSDGYTDSWLEETESN